jgi:hypothetical protein
VGGGLRVAASYVAWVRPARAGWRAVADGPTPEAAYRLLPAWVGRQPRKLPGSAVLPAGAHPAERGGRA